MQSPPPLCEFIEYLDLEQSPKDIAEVERIAQEARERWRAMELFDSFMHRSNEALREDEDQRRKFESARKQEEEEARKRVERNVRLRGRGCARELVALGNPERQDSGRESIPLHAV